jgi:hypothetical protein
MSKLVKRNLKGKMLKSHDNANLKAKTQIKKEKR